MCYRNDRVTLSRGQLTAATLLLPGVAILNRKTISLSRDGQYKLRRGLGVRGDHENVPLSIPEVKMEVKPLVKPPWTLRAKGIGLTG